MNYRKLMMRCRCELKLNGFVRWYDLIVVFAMTVTATAVMSAIVSAKFAISPAVAESAIVAAMMSIAFMVSSEEFRVSNWLGLGLGSGNWNW